MSNDYFYDQQIRRYQLQFNRIFSTFKWKTGKNSSGFEEYRTVPCMVAPSSRHVAWLMRDGKENTTNTVPQFATYIEAVRMAPERRQNPEYVRSSRISERKLDQVTGNYSGELGNQYTVDSYMPVPYDIIMKCELITSNVSQKHQLLEQILILFNPSLDLQTSQNPYDWTALTVVELTDIQWTSTTMPIQDDSNDVTTMTFNVRAMLNPPSKVKRQTIIKEIITNIGEMNDMKDEWQADGTYFSLENTLSQTITTPGDLSIRISPRSEGVYSVKLLPRGKNDFDEEYTWPLLFSKIGGYVENETELVIMDHASDLDSGFIRCGGTISIKDDSTVMWTINKNSLPPLDEKVGYITDVINPTKFNPSSSDFKVPTKGDRYIIMSDVIIQNSEVWGIILDSVGDVISGDVAVLNNDVIEYDGKNWRVVFQGNTGKSLWSFCQSTEDYILFNGNTWVSAIDGDFGPGLWRIKGSF